MNLKIYKIANRYAFSIDNFASSYHYFLCNNVKSSYEYAWEAYRDAKNILANKPVHVQALNKCAKDEFDKPIITDVSAEQMLYDHYQYLFELITHKVKSLGGEDKSRNFMVKAEINSILLELDNILAHFESPKADRILNKLISKFKALLEGKFASSNNRLIQSKLDNSIKKAMIRDYAEAICKSIQNIHKGCIFKESLDTISILDADDDSKPLLKIKINNNLNITDIIPLGDLKNIYTPYSIKFYEKYWKRIIKAVGNYYIEDLDILIIPKLINLPDSPRVCPVSHAITGWDTKNKQEHVVNMTFSEDIDATWSFERSKEEPQLNKRASSVLTEEDFINNNPARVRCITPELTEIYGKVGEVVQVIPLDDHIELDINFGREVMRLTESQIEIVNAI